MILILLIPLSNNIDHTYYIRTTYCTDSRMNYFIVSLWPKSPSIRPSRLCAKQFTSSNVHKNVVREKIQSRQNLPTISDRLETSSQLYAYSNEPILRIGVLPFTNAVFTIP